MRYNGPIKDIPLSSYSVSLPWPRPAPPQKEGGAISFSCGISLSSKTGLPAPRQVLVRQSSLVGAARFELATLCSQSRCATWLRHAPNRRLMMPHQIHQATGRDKPTDSLPVEVIEPDMIAGLDGKPLRSPGEKLEHGAHRASRWQGRLGHGSRIGHDAGDPPILGNKGHVEG